MITFSNEDKRWLEIIFYLLCRKIFSINQDIEDIYKFIEGYRWTNMFDCDILIKTVRDKKILLDTDFIPSKREFLVTMDNNNCRLRMGDRKSIRELIKDTEYTYWNKDIFHTQMREEIHQTELFPKLNIPKIHETIYSFLLALRYVADIIKKIKF